MSTTSNLKQGLLAGLVICVLAAGCSSNGGRGDTSIADNDTTTTTTQSVEEPSTTTEAEPTTTTTLGVAEPSTTAEAEPATTADSDADITTTTTVGRPDHDQRWGYSRRRGCGGPRNRHRRSRRTDRCYPHHRVNPTSNHRAVNHRSHHNH